MRSLAGTLRMPILVAFFRRFNEPPEFSLRNLNPFLIRTYSRFRSISGSRRIGLARQACCDAVLANDGMGGVSPGSGDPGNDPDPSEKKIKSWT